jgi:glucokinase
MQLTEAQNLTLGVDLGGTKIAAALVDSAGRIVAHSRRTTRVERGPDAIVTDLIAAAVAICGQADGRRVVAMGVGVAGQVDPATGAVFNAPNLHWKDFPFQERVQENVRMPVSVLNDVQAATFGEWIHGAGRGSMDLVCIFAGTGVGGGVVAQGQLVRGAVGSAGEIGHMTVNLAGPRCRCGNFGCVEAFAGGWAIAHRAQEAVKADAASGQVLLALAGGDAQRINASTVARALNRADPLAMRLVEETGEALGAGAASIVNGFNPALLILGGGVIEGLPELVAIVERTVRRRALPAAAERVRIVRPQLGTHAGAIGAATWARVGQPISAAVGNG